MTTISILCGNCKLYHVSVEDVRACYAGAKVEVKGPAVLSGHIPTKGRYSVEFPADKSWKTLSFKAGKGNWANKIVISLLTGPDNVDNYTGIGHAENGVVTFWKSKKHLQTSIVIEALRVILNNDNDNAARAGLAYAVQSGNCYRCGKDLTVPTSVSRGLGPECAKLV